MFLMTNSNTQTFTTHTRDEAILESIKIAELLSEYGVLDKTIKILIVGGDGKSLIVDAIAVTYHKIMTLLICLKTVLSKARPWLLQI